MPRYELREDGHHFDTVEADNLAAALDLAADTVDRDNYPDADGTIWVDVYVDGVDTTERDSVTVQLDPPEPPCIDNGGHAWSDDLDLVGGCKENPGVFGHGGGVLIVEGCTRCGCGKTVDTWAQRPDNGTQGHTTVRYDPDRFAHRLDEFHDHGDDDDE